MAYVNTLSRQVCALAFASVASLAHANLLTNGSFESGAFVNQGNGLMSVPVASTVITGWTAITNVVAWIGPANPYGLSASNGNYFLDFAEFHSAPFAGVQQTIATVPGATYLLTFDLGASNNFGRPDSISVTVAGESQSFIAPAAGTNNDWYRESMQFVAVASSSSVVFQGATGNNYVGLDNAAVELVSLPVPEPLSWELLAAGLLSFAALRRRTNWHSHSAGAA